MADTRPPARNIPMRIIAVIAGCAFTLFAVGAFGWPDDDVNLTSATTHIVFVEQWPGGEPDLTAPPERVSHIAPVPVPVQHAALQPGRDHVGLDVGVRRWRGIRSA